MLSLLKLAALPYGIVARERRAGLVILIYHRVGGGTDSDIDLPVEVFDAQMAHIRDRYVPVSLDAVIDRTTPQPAPGRDLVAVTFDDGYRELYDRVMPVLERHRIPATVYVATRYVEQQRPFDFGAYARTGEQPMPLTWPQLREMAASGLVAVGGHTHSHINLVEADTATARDEVRRCRSLIEERLSVASRHFAYPWGVFDARTRDLVGEYFATATRGGSAKNLLDAMDPLALWRRPIQQNDSLWLFKLKLASYLDGEEMFRTFAARVLRRERTVEAAPPAGPAP
jgi:peptidoglycan/xylan/chitin deacetylase (PgdA/CDA1 family)